MYLKSIEMQGFKSFANKIVLDFHQGITGIVGPNGSGKSNVADAVRWVLGEQSAKQLRSENMQDVIFSGTETRHPLSYAYVAITMDNSDHVLPVEYEEVTVARRVYRSGESEYLINGAPCRLRDVHELFYDTGIGKEGYSIIGQGQIEKILSGKPEDRRELFDEAVGIVKYKKRKAASEKKLESEEANLVRINDILSELEGRVGPLKEQSDTAKEYLSCRERMKKLDINLYLLETERIEKETAEVAENEKTTGQDLSDSKAELESIRKEYEKIEETIREMDERTEEIHKEETESRDEENRLKNQAALLEEQIRSAESSEQGLSDRRKSMQEALQKKEKEREEKQAEYEKQKEEYEKARSITEEKEQAHHDLTSSIDDLNQRIDENHEKIVSLLNQKAEVKGEIQKYQAIRDQTNIRRTEIIQRVLSQKTNEEKAENALKEAQETYLARDEDCRSSDEEKKKLSDEADQISWKMDESTASYQKITRDIHVLSSKRDALQSVMERYDGYQNSIRRVMEQKKNIPGIIGVVSDLIQVDKKVETAIETALGGNIQNVVTEDESAAKAMIRFLKENRAGRATFLPLTSVHPKKDQGLDRFKNEPGVIGIASELVRTEDRYRDIMEYLLGRILVMDTLDHATSFAKKTGYRNHIVTLEGEYLRPGGSMTGGSFKNANNLLGRNRELQELQDAIKNAEEKAEEAKKELASEKEKLEEKRREIAEAGEASQKLLLERNTAEIALTQAKENLNEVKGQASSLTEEQEKIDQELSDLEESLRKVRETSENSEQMEKDLEDEIKKFQEEVSEKQESANKAAGELSESRLAEANVHQSLSFIEENLNRLDQERKESEEALSSLEKESRLTREEAEKKKEEIGKLTSSAEEAAKRYEALEQERKETVTKKESLNESYRGFFDKREEVSQRISGLDKELYRLNTKHQKLDEELGYQNNYMWEEYELTLHSAMEERDPEMTDRNGMKRELSEVRDTIRKMGSVNVNAIEEYKEVFERYEFLKGQHDDLVAAKESLLSVIQDLDSGMRKQFKEGFEKIREEFDKAFRALFGGGHGTLELVDGEDLLETGIRIIAQPPGKKLQNMMQMSGGEKALTAISLLFAIQNLKPSPFCLLDEIEAALDDSNVDRFARYLHKLTKHTQFIVITHRRGTMNACDRLYGITMQEKGVSTLVSVSLIDKDLTD